MRWGAVKRLVAVRMNKGTVDRLRRPPVTDRLAGEMRDQRVVTRLRGTINSSASCGLSGLNPLQEGFHVGVVEDEGAQQVA